ncbi:MAG: hypothetical protein ACRBK7_20450 [Acidimicrobiales bacterium]
MTAEERLALNEPVDRVVSLMAEQLADTQVRSVDEQVLRYSILSRGVERLAHSGPDRDAIWDRVLEEIAALATRFSDTAVAQEIVTDETSYGRFHWCTTVLCINTAPEILGSIINPLANAALVVQTTGPEFSQRMQGALSLADLHRRALEDGHQTVVERLTEPLERLAVTSEDLPIRLEGIGALLRDRSNLRGIALLTAEINRLSHESHHGTGTDSESGTDTDDLQAVFDLTVEIPRHELFDPIRVFVAKSMSATRTVPRPARAALAFYQRNWPQPLNPLGAR